MMLMRKPAGLTQQFSFYFPAPFFVCVASCFVAAVLTCRATHAEQVFWTDFESVKTASSNGGNIQTIVNMDPAGGNFLTTGGIVARDHSLFWTGLRQSAIFHSNLEGTDAAKLVDALLSLNGAALKTDNGMLYWADGYSAIWRANLDGSDAKRLVNLVGVFGQQSYAPYGLAFHGNSIYWTDWIHDTIDTAKLDGSDAHVLIDLAAALPGQPLCCQVVQGIAASDNFLYWTDPYRDSIYRANLDGSAITKLIDLPAVFGLGNYVPRDIVVFGSSLYWVDSGADAIFRSNLDGSAAQVITSQVGNEVEFLSVVPEPGTAFLAIEILALTTSICFRTRRGRRWTRC